MKWYVVNTVSGQEQKVKAAILDGVAKHNVADDVEEILIPSEKVSKFSRGKKVVGEKKFFPGYIFIKAKLTDIVWNMIKNIPQVGTFLGANGKPHAVHQSEIDAIKQQLESGTTMSDLDISFDIAESVKITDGAFKSFMGVIEEIDTQKQRLKVSVTILGRSTPVELSYNQVQKM